MRSRQFLAMKSVVPPDMIGGWADVVSIFSGSSMNLLRELARDSRRGSLGVELDDELLADRQRHVVARGHRLDGSLEGVLVELHPAGHAAPFDRAERLDDAGHGARLL